jgi:hypothetical protein
MNLDQEQNILHWFKREKKFVFSLRARIVTKENSYIFNRNKNVYMKRIVHVEQMIIDLEG